MKEIDYTDHRVRLLFITGIILVFIILFTSFLYSMKSVDSSAKSSEKKSEKWVSKDSVYNFNVIASSSIHKNIYA